MTSHFEEIQIAPDAGDVIDSDGSQYQVAPVPGARAVWGWTGPCGRHIGWLMPAIEKPTIQDHPGRKVQQQNLPRVSLHGHPPLSPDWESPLGSKPTHWVVSGTRRYAAYSDADAVWVRDTVGGEIHEV